MGTWLEGLAVHVSEAMVNHVAGKSDTAIGWHDVGLTIVP